MVRSALARWGITHQVFKAALAASASYAIAAHILDHRFPVFAPMAALLTIQVNLFGSLHTSIQRILAIVIGVGVAMLAFHFTGANWWIIFLVVLITLMLGTRMRLGIAAINQVPMSALLILAAKGYVPTYAVDRIVNTLVGTATAVIINSLLWPPDTLPEAKAAVTRLAKGIADLLRQAAAALSGEGGAKVSSDLIEAARGVDQLMGQTFKTVSTARSGLKMNPSAGRLAPTAERCAAMADTLERAGIQARGIAKSVSELLKTVRDDLPEAKTLAGLLAAAARQVESSVQARQDGCASARDAAVRAYGDCGRLYREVSRSAIAGLRDADEGEVWPRYGSILADVRHLSEELEDSVSDQRWKALAPEPAT